MVDRIHFVFLNVGHFYDHLFMLVFATVAALSLSHEWGMSYAEVIPYATPGFVAFAVCAVPAGWLADKWSRKGMMVVFYVGIGLSSIFTSLAETPLQIGIGLFAAIYHPVGLALVVQGRENTGVPLAINGIFGNVGVACAALITGFLIDHAGWRSAFVWPGFMSIATGIAYAGLLYAARDSGAEEGYRRVAASGTYIQPNLKLVGISICLLWAFYSCHLGTPFSVRFWCPLFLGKFLDYGHRYVTCYFSALHRWAQENYRGLRSARGNSSEDRDNPREPLSSPSRKPPFSPFRYCQSPLSLKPRPEQPQST